MPKHTRVTGPDAEQMGSEMRRLYETGMSIRDLSEEYQRSYGAVHKMLQEAGVELRVRGGLAGRIRRNTAAGATPLSRQQIFEYRQRLATR
jgi:hypothetical protein